MTKEELYKIKGGAGVNATLLNSIARCIEAIYNLGRATGTGIKMIFSKSSC